MKHSVTLYNAQAGYAAYCALWAQVKALLLAGHRVELTAKTETRSSAQNSRMWAMLTDVSRQVDWYGRKLSPEEWKHVFSAAIKKQDVVPGLDGGFVVLGQSTSQMTVPQMTELMDLIDAFGSQRSVAWSDPGLEQPPQASSRSARLNEQKESA